MEHLAVGPATPSNPPPSGTRSARISVVQFAARSAGYLDAEALQSSVARACERQALLAEPGRLDYKLVYNEPIDKSYTEIAQEAIDPVDFARRRGERGAAILVVRLLRCVGNEDILVIVADRRYVDPLSFCLLLSDIKLLYESGLSFALAPLEVQFEEYNAWRADQREAARAAGTDTQTAFWQHHLAGSLPKLELPAEPPSAPGTDVSSLPALSSNEEKLGDAVAHSPISLPTALCDQLRALAIQEHLPLRVLLLAAFHAFLAKHTGKSDIILGYHVSGRTQHVELKNVVGSFENWAPLRLQSTDHPSVRDFVDRVGSALTEAEANAEIPLEDIMRAVGASESLFKAGFEVYGNIVEEYGLPLISSRVMRFVLGLEQVGGLQPSGEGSLPSAAGDGDHRHHHDEDDAFSIPSSADAAASSRGPLQTKPLIFGGVRLDPIPLRSLVERGDDDLRLVGTTSPVFRLAFHYNTAALAPNTVARMGVRFQTLLEDIVARFTQIRISDLRVLPPAEEEEVLRKFNETASDFNPDMKGLLVHELVERAAQRTPNAVAVSVHGGRESLTYRELEAKANQLANFLQLVGVGDEDPVMVLLPRSPMLTVAWLAVLKAGAAVMPADTKFPASRIKVMAEDARCPVAITDTSLEDLFEGTDPRLVVIDRDWDRAINLGSSQPPPPRPPASGSSFSGASPDAPAGSAGASSSSTGTGSSLNLDKAEAAGEARTNRLSSLAYVIYTSGSTGKPKGVMLDHAALTNYIRWHISRYEMTAEDRVFACAGLAFDASIADTWPTLSIGACLLPVVDPDVTVVPPRLLDWIVRERATMGFLTTQICEMVLEEDATYPRQDLRSLRVLYTGGDRLHMGPRQDAPYKLYNIYGPTENTVNSTMCEVPKGLRTPPTIGPPVPNTQCLILDPESFTPVPIGVYGELFLSGVQLARGYLNLPDLSAERFIHNPFDIGSKRMYRTGDLCRWLPDGHIDFLGRIDTQVKIRGNRVELTAIESRMLVCQGVKDAIVVAREDTPGNKRLVAYFIAKDDAKDKESGEMVTAIRNWLAAELPSFMVPSAFVQMDGFPLTANHKVDRRELPPPSQGQRPGRPANNEIPPDASNLRRQVEGLLGSGAPKGQSGKGHEPHGNAAGGGSRYSALVDNMRGIFCEELGISHKDSVHIDPRTLNFFEAGGDSLGAGRVATQMSRLLHVDVPVSLLYTFPRLESYCKAAATTLTAGGSAARAGEIDLSAQRSTGIFSESDEVALNPAQPAEHNLPSFNEESLWLVCQAQTQMASQAYNVSFSCRLARGNMLDAGQLRQALLELTRANESLRATYIPASRANTIVERVVIPADAVVEDADTDANSESDGGPRLRLDMEEQTVTGCTSDDIKGWLERETYRPFDLAKGPLLRVRLATFQRDPSEPSGSELSESESAENDGVQVFLVVVHHIVTDLWSIVLLLDRLMDAYRGKPPTPSRDTRGTREFTYSDFILLQRKLMEGSRGQKLLNFWTQELRDDRDEEAKGTLDLPLDRPRPPVKSFRGAALRFELDARPTQQLLDICTKTSFTLSVILLSCFSIALRAFSGSNRVQVGVPTAGRWRSEFERIIGYFVNPIVVRADLAGDPTLVQLWNRVSAVMLRGLDNQSLPFSMLAEQQAQSGATRGGGRSGENPLFNVAFVLQRPHLNRPGLAKSLLGFDGVKIDFGEGVPAMESLSCPHRHAQFDLTLMLCLEDGRLAGSLQYNTDVFQEESMTRLGNALQSIMTQVAASDPERVRISGLGLLSEEERKIVLTDFNSARSAGPPVAETATVHGLVEAQAARTPEKVCVETPSLSLTYSELDRRSNRLANFLRFAGIRRETLVPVFLSRSAHLVVVWLAILKAGGVIMPLDPKYPIERVRGMLDDAKATVVVTELALQEGIPANFQGRRVVVDRDWDDVIALASDAKVRALDHSSKQLAYAIFTSGSTGQPKGVLLEHASLVNYIRWHIEYYELTEEDRVLSCAGLAFDAAMADTWPTLAVGACLIPVIDPDLSVVAPRLLDWIIDNKVSMGFLTTQLCEMVLEEESAKPREDIGALRLLYTGGDRLHFGAHAAAQYRLVNIYGPTETTINATMTTVPAGMREPPSIGRPAAGVACMVLDPENLTPLPVGVFGELFIAGRQLARGYFNLPELTKERFLSIPTDLLSDLPAFVKEQEARMYRTGDLVRWRQDGYLEFLGRRDTQVKIRGNRIELVAIESVMLQHPEIRDAVVVVSEQGRDKVLVGYFIPRVGAQLTSSALRKFLSASLPGFMVPSSFVSMDSFPLTQNHKVDRRALPPPRGSGQQQPQEQQAQEQQQQKSKSRRGSLSTSSARSLSRRFDSNSTAGSRSRRGLTDSTSELAQNVGKIFADELGLKPEELDDTMDFFDEGGHSFAAGRMLATLESDFGVRMQLPDFLRNPTLRAVIQFVSAAVKSKGAALPTDGGSSVPGGRGSQRMESGSHSLHSEPMPHGGFSQQPPQPSQHSQSRFSFSRAASQRPEASRSGPRPGALTGASSTTKLLSSSYMSSSLRDTTISDWLQERRSPKDRNEPLGLMHRGHHDDAASDSLTSGSQTSSTLRRVRETQTPTPDHRQLQSLGSHVVRGSARRNALQTPRDRGSTLPLSLAHTPMWSGSMHGQQALQDRLQKLNDMASEGVVGDASPDGEEGPDICVLSYNQQSLWFMHKMDPRRVDFVVHVCCTLDLPIKTTDPESGSEAGLDVDCLRAALQALVDRHQSLRTTYGEENGLPYQIIHPVRRSSSDAGGSGDAASAPKTPNKVDFVAELAPAESRDALFAKVRAELHRPWDIQGAAPFRARLYTGSDEKAVLLLTAHHIAMDGWSLDLVLSDLGMLYDAASEGTLGQALSTGMDSTMTVAEFAKIQKEDMNSAVGLRLWAFWQRQLAGHEATLDLPTEADPYSSGGSSSSVMEETESKGSEAKPTDQEATRDGAWHFFDIDAEVFTKVQRIVRQESALPFMALVAFYAGLLYRYTGKEDILIGTPMACRTKRPGLGHTVGNITNIVVLRMHVSKEDNFQSLLRQARTVVSAAMDHEELPFAVLVEKMGSHRSAGRSPVFQVLLSMNQSFTRGGANAPSLARLESGETVPIGSRLRMKLEKDVVQEASPYDLQLIFTKSDVEGDPLRAALQYKTTLFAEETMRNFASHFQALVNGSAETPTRLYCSLPLLTNHEKQVILADWNRTGRAFDESTCVHALFETCAESRPFACALGWRGRTWTYGELNARANVLARYLRHRRVGPSSNVGLFMERSPNMVLAMLAVAKAGAAYVPMDVNWPLDRLAYVFKDSEMCVVLCDRESMPLLDGLGGLVADDGISMPRRIPIDTRWNHIASKVEGPFGTARATGNLPPPASHSWGSNAQQWRGSRSPLYMIYTSGSTGNPKGVLVEHRSVVNLVNWHIREYDLTPRDRASQLVGSAFDPVGLEIWPFLSVGASVHFVEDDEKKVLSELRACLHDNRITVSLLPTPLLEVFLRTRTSGKGTSTWPSSLRVVYGGGDKLHVPRDVLAQIPFRLDNHYGPSEGTIMCTFFTTNSLLEDNTPTESSTAAKDKNGGKPKVRGKAVLSPFIGRPLDNFGAFILDDFLEPVPVLVAGELCIAGPGLAQGYFQRADLTRERFIDLPPTVAAAVEQNPSLGFLAGSKLYRTGDRVRFQRDGNIEFIGRVDFQVKIRGMRVELGEIESVLKQHNAVLEACVIVREDEGQQRLCAYVVPSDEDDATYGEVERIHALQSLVKDKLPAHMVPVAWVFMEALPVTANGKIDRRALPAPSESEHDMHGQALRAVVPPRSKEEVVIADLWKETLGLQSISIHDNFFDLGGHSLAAAQLLDMVHENLGVELSLAAFFEEPSVAGMAAAVRGLTGGPNEGGGDGSSGLPAPETAEHARGFDPAVECVLDEDIAPAETSILDPEVSESWSRIFVTGATGFLGAFFVHHVLEALWDVRPDVTVLCLVRADNDAEAMVRLRSTFLKFELYSEDSMPSIGTFEDSHLDWAGVEPPGGMGARHRILVVRGDLGEPRFGMPAHDFERFAQELDVIAHAGASVNSVLPYKRLRRVNVEGTKEVIRLACARRDRRVLLLHVSTLSVFAPPSRAFENADEMGAAETSDEEPTFWFGEESDLTDAKDLHHLEGYAQTKWVAEHLVREAHARGLPVCIFRPGRITGHSVTGMASFGDFMCLFLKGCLQLQAAPDLNWVMDMNPVDYVCRAMLQLLTIPPARGGVLGRAFNMCHPDPWYLPEYIGWLVSAGYMCDTIPYSDWRTRLQRAVKDHAGSSSSCPSSGATETSRVYSSENLSYDEVSTTAKHSANALSSSSSSTSSFAMSAASETPSPPSSARYGSSRHGSMPSKPVPVQSSLHSIKSAHASAAGSRGSLYQQHHQHLHEQHQQEQEEEEEDEEQEQLQSASAAPPSRRQLAETENDKTLDALRSLAVVFNGMDAEGVQPSCRLKFEVSSLIDVNYPSKESMNQVSLDCMVRFKFIPPPARVNEAFFTFE